MVVRNEAVRLSLQDDFTSKMARAAAATALLDKNLRSLSGSSVQSDRALAAQEKTVRKTGDSSERSGNQIDKLSGRLAILAQAASVLGPALVPLGAPLVGVMAGLTAQLGAVAGAVGVGVLAFKGMGDALGAVNDYQLEPTADNLQAMRVEMEKLGPAGAEFVTFIDGLGPQLSKLQIAAREGLLPGAQEGIESLMTMMPRVRNIVSDIAEAMGGLAADAGADLAGDDWREFFRYLNQEAGPLLTEFGQTVGNFAQGFAGLLVGLGPLTDDFSGGLLGMSEAFAEWSAGLASNESFQEFLDYVRESGPDAVAMLGQIAVTFAEIIEAAAPVGDAVLPILTKFLDLVGNLASSPLGSMFFTAAAGLSVYSRAAALATGATKRLEAAQLTATGAGKRLSGGMAALRANAGTAAAGLGMVALASTDLDDKAGISNTAMLTLAGSLIGPWGAAAGAAAGLTMDLASANDDLAAAIERANNAANSGTNREQIAAYEELERQVASTDQAIDDMLGGRDTAGENVFQQISGDISTTFKGLGAILTNASEEGRGALFELSTSIGTTDFTTRQLADSLGMTAQQFRVASGDAESFIGALARMAGFLDRRAALRDYREEIKNFSNALKDGFQPKNAEGLDRFASSILTVASGIKSLPARERFFADAQQQLLDFAKTGPKAEEAVEKIIAQFVRLGLMPPIKPKVDPDTKGADDKIDRTRGGMDDLDRKRPKPKVDADTKGADDKISTTDRLMLELGGRRPRPKVDADISQAERKEAALRRRLVALAAMKPSPKVDAEIAEAIAKLVAIQARINGLRDKEVTITTRQKTVIENIMGYDGPRGDRKKTSSAMGDIFNAHQPQIATPHTRVWAEPETGGEAYIPLRNDHRRPRAKDILETTASMFNGRVEWFATGGMAGGSNIPRSGGPNLMTPSGIAPFLFDPLTTSMRGLRRELSRSEKAVERERNQRDALISKRNDVASGIRDGLGGDIWAGASNPWSAGATSNPTDMLQQQTAQAREFTRLVQSLKSKGLDGAALAEVIGSGDIERARMMAALPASALRQFERAYNVNQQAMASAGAAGGQAAYGAQIAEQTREFKQANRRLDAIEWAIKNKGKDDDRSRRTTARETADSNRRGAARGARNRPNG